MSSLAVSHLEVENAARLVAIELAGENLHRIFPVPRGGVPAAYLVQRILQNVHFIIVDDPFDADVIIDDLVDSGATRNRYRSQYPEVPFITLFDKRNYPPGTWLVFPWEQSHEGSADDIPLRLLQYIGEDPSRQGLRDTPKRFLAAWAHWARGYDQNPSDVLTAFEDGAEKVDEMVVVRNIPFYSHCEHHLAPFFGTVHIGYIPNGRIVGLSKLSRLVKVYALRLQVQERMTNEIADALQKHLAPLGVGVAVEARHLCMESRGICEQGHTTITSAVRGAIKDKPEARSEFMALTGFTNGRA